MRFFPLLILTVLILTAAVFWLTQGTPEPTKEEADITLPASDIGGSFTLTDQNGNQVKNTDLKGKYLLVFFGFTHCPDICPVTLSTISQAMKLLGDDANLITPLFITVDPERDTPQALKTFLSAFNPHITGLTGSPQEIEDLVKSYKGYAKKESGIDAANYTVNHTGFVYLMGKNGEYLAHLDGQISAQDMVSAIRNYLVK